MNAIDCQKLVKTYGGTRVLDDVSFTVQAGEIFVFLGPSGCGKTTSLKILSGLEEPDSGTVLLDGKTANDPAIRIPAHQRNLAMVFQTLALWPHMTVEDNLLFVLKEPRDPRARKDEVRTILGRFQLEGREKSYPGDLSQGERQRVAIARAMLQKPRIMLLDEPFSNLDYTLRAVLLEELRRLQRDQEITMVYVTHHQEEAMVLADHLAVLSRGRIEQVGTPADIYFNPANKYVAGFVGVNNLLPATVDDSGQVDTVLGRFPAQGRQAGQKVWVSVRPAGLEVSPEGTVNGRVTDCKFLGGHWMLTVAVHDSAVRVEHRAGCEPGEEVRLKLLAAPAILAGA